mgnify:CR=1 FL=1
MERLAEEEPAIGWAHLLIALLFIFRPQGLVAVAHAERV